jgi:hypothetical protein
MLTVDEEDHPILKQVRANLRALEQELALVRHLRAAVGELQDIEREIDLRTRVITEHPEVAHHQQPILNALQYYQLALRTLLNIAEEQEHL